MSIGPGTRELSVTAGKLWLTLHGELDEPAEDYWLEAGQSLTLPSGSRVVMEAWPQASFQLLVPPCGEAQRARRSAATPFWRRFQLSASSSSLAAPSAA